jgi:hypothetical protein
MSFIKDDALKSSYHIFRPDTAKFGKSWERRKEVSVGRTEYRLFNNKINKGYWLVVIGY